jgi:hypothetical protein
VGSLDELVARLEEVRAELGHGQTDELRAEHFRLMCDIQREQQALPPRRPVGGPHPDTVGGGLSVNGG